ncbi:MAG TPA: hypothetical protein VNX68_08210 [Nitrosopumilaceae archaeon]|nr:hypothetical protein [Nitrosopumilaceae archaeon]
MLFSVQLIALTCAVFLFVYVKKQQLNKWFTFISVAIAGVVLLTMAATFVAAICMGACGRERGEGKRMFMHHEMGGERMGKHGGWDRDRDEEREEGRDRWKRDREDCDDQEECNENEKHGECCKGKEEKEENCTVFSPGPGKVIIIKKDSVVQKGGKK